MRSDFGCGQRIRNRKAGSDLILRQNRINKICRFHRSFSAFCFIMFGSVQISKYHIVRYSSLKRWGFIVFSIRCTFQTSAFNKPQFGLSHGTHAPLSPLEKAIPIVVALSNNVLSSIRPLHATVTIAARIHVYWLVSGVFSRRLIGPFL